MKMTCAKCGKRFDAEGCMYICPKCNHYHSQVGARGRTAEQEEGEDKPFFSITRPENRKEEVRDKIADNFADDAESGRAAANENFSVDNLKKLAENKVKADLGAGIVKKIITIVAVAIGIIVISAFLFFGQLMKDLGVGESDYDMYYPDEVSEIEVGEVMDFDTFESRVSDYNEVEFEGDKVDEGYKLIRVDFETDSPYDEDNEEDCSNTLTDVCLIADELFYYAEYPEDVAVDEELADYMYEEGMVQEIQFDGSWYCIFEIPEDEYSVELLVTSYAMGDDYSGNIVYSIDLEL